MVKPSQIANALDPGLMLDMNEFSDWLATSVNGARVCYFVGHLAEACGECRRETQGVAGLAQAAAARGAVCLTQRKIAEGKFEYLATQCKGTGSALAELEAVA